MNPWIPRRAVRAALAATAVACAAGCVSFPRYGSKVKVSETRRENATGVLDTRVVPVVTRSGRDALVRFKVSGLLTNACETTAVYRRDVIGAARFGFFPGVRPDVPQCAFLAGWYNVCMLCAPTLDGLFLEWFRDPDGSDGFEPAPKGAFRRSALFGYYSERTKNPKSETLRGEPETVVKAVESLYLPVGPEPYQISVGVPDGQMRYERVDGACGIRLLGVYPENPDAGTPSVASCRATLSVPKEYGLKAELVDDEGEPVEIPL